MGWQVYAPKPGTEIFALQPSWPRLLTKSSSQPSKRNLDIHGYEDYENVRFGEDRFISQEIEEIQQKLYEADATVELIDVENENVEIDAWHTTPNSIVELDQWVSFAKKNFPNAKWISSCITHWDQSLKYEPKNIVKFLPASYKNIRPDLNQTKMYRHRIEFDVCNVDYTANLNRNGWASFNHNFAIRQPQHYALQNAVNEALKHKLHVQNHGGNIRVQGADIKFSGENGVTGKDPTLSPRQAMKKYTELRGVLHLKQADWAGGVPSMSRMAKVPIVVTGRYVEDTCAHEMFIHDQNCLIANNLEDLIKYVEVINDDDSVWQKLSNGQDKLNETLFDEEYWKNWESFLEKLV
jgi:hypothetical protein